MVNVLALDLATKTGYAAVINGQLESGVQDFSLKRGESPGMRYIRFNIWLGKLIELSVNATQGESFQVVAYEMPHQRGGHATEIALGLATRVQEKCALYGLEHMPVHSATVKKHATGSGRASKEAVIEAMKKRWPGVETLDDNHADALAILSYVLKELGESQNQGFGYGFNF